MLYLRQSTASQSVLIGPFVDSTDGNTAETALTIVAADIRLSANGGNMFAKTSGGGTHDEAGWYTITLDATDSATVGRLQVSVHVAGALPVFAEFQVLEEVVFDAFYAAASAGLPPITANWITAAGINAAALNDKGNWTVGKSGYTLAPTSGLGNQTSNIIGNITGNVTGSVGSVGTDGISAAAIAAAAANKIADHVRRRTQANIEASSDGDALSLGSLYGLIQQGQESNATATPGSLTVYRTDGTTVLGTKTLTTNATADPVDGIS